MSLKNRLIADEETFVSVMCPPNIVEDLKLKMSDEFGVEFTAVDIEEGKLSVSKPNVPLFGETIESSNR